MSLRFLPDTGAADWLTSSETPWDRLVTFGPEGLGAHARVRFLPDPAHEGQEADVARPDDRVPDIEQVRRVVRVLARHTTTPDELYLCLWEGYSDTPPPPAVAAGPLVTVPHRRYALLHGSATDLDAWEATVGDGQPVAPPAFVWPADHAWIVASDVDPHWAGVGGAPAAIADLRATPGLDVAPADPAAAQPAYR